MSDHALPAPDNAGNPERRIWLIATGAAAGVATVATAGAAGNGGTTAREFLAATFGISKSDSDRIAAGRVYSRTLPVRHGREVATLGIVRINGTPARYVERLTDIVSFKNDEADRILEEYRVTFDADERKQLYARFQEILYDEQPYTFLFAPAAVTVWDRRFHGVTWYDAMKYPF